MATLSQLSMNEQIAKLRQLKQKRAEIESKILYDNVKKSQANESKSMSSRSQAKVTPIKRLYNEKFSIARDNQPQSQLESLNSNGMSSSSANRQISRQKNDLMHMEDDQLDIRDIGNELYTNPRPLFDEYNGPLKPHDNNQRFHSQTLPNSQPHQANPVESGPMNRPGSIDRQQRADPQSDNYKGFYNPKAYDARSYGQKENILNGSLSEDAHSYGLDSSKTNSVTDKVKSNEDPVKPTKLSNTKHTNGSSGIPMPLKQEKEIKIDSHVDTSLFNEFQSLSSYISPVRHEGNGLSEVIINGERYTRTPTFHSLESRERNVPIPWNHSEYDHDDREDSPFRELESKTSILSIVKTEPQPSKGSIDFNEWTNEKDAVKGRVHASKSHETVHHNHKARDGSPRQGDGNNHSLDTLRGNNFHIVDTNHLKEAGRYPANDTHMTSEQMNEFDNSISTVNIIDDVEVTRRQYQTTLKLLYDSNVEQSKLRTLLDYATSNYSSKVQIQQDIINMITEMVQKHIKPSSKRDEPYLSKISEKIWKDTLLVRNLQEKIRQVVKLTHDLEMEQKKALESEAAMAILREQYTESLDVNEKLKQTVKNLKRKIALDGNERYPTNISSQSTPPQSPHTKQTRQRSNRPVPPPPPLPGDPIVNESTSQSKISSFDSTAGRQDPDEKEIEKDKVVDEPKDIPEIKRTTTSTSQPILLDIDLGDGKVEQVLIDSDTDPLMLAIGFLQDHSLPKYYLEPLISYIQETQRKLGTVDESSDTVDDPVIESSSMDINSSSNNDVETSHHIQPAKEETTNETVTMEEVSPMIISSIEPQASSTEDIHDVRLKDESKRPHRVGRRYSQSDIHSKVLEKSTESKTYDQMNQETPSEGKHTVSHETIKPLSTPMRYSPAVNGQKLQINSPSPSETARDIDDTLSPSLSISDLDTTASSNSSVPFLSPSAVIDPMDSNHSTPFSQIHASSKIQSDLIAEADIQTTRSPERSNGVYPLTAPYPTSPINEQALIASLPPGETFETAVDAFDRATDLINQGKLSQAAPLYDFALSLFQSHGVPEDHLKVMEEEVLYWVKQAQQMKPNALRS